MGERGKEQACQPWDAVLSAPAGFCKPGGSQRKANMEGNKMSLHVRWGPQGTAAAGFKLGSHPSVACEICLVGCCKPL